MKLPSLIHGSGGNINKFLGDLDKELASSPYVKNQPTPFNGPECHIDKEEGEIDKAIV